ncbi:unnamed protein product [Didymodactylos carnosus]|uniref:Uncharacterized protein n=1 Tax=Didymodactylos carnosus TaxID=1234261 RepID=A0A816B3X4_9BILA|nr:unnamed protein product [Didymodactylos carnosus]CAF4484631.1 unnamed protein product [Didymodactylos carnosus]
MSRSIRNFSGLFRCTHLPCSNTKLQQQGLQCVLAPDRACVRSSISNCLKFNLSVRSYPKISFYYAEKRQRLRQGGTLFPSNQIIILKEYPEIDTEWPPKRMLKMSVALLNRIIQTAKMLRQSLKISQVQDRYSSDLIKRFQALGLALELYSEERKNIKRPSQFLSRIIPLIRSIQKQLCCIESE